MKTKLLILTAILLAILSCNKDAYTSRPQLTFKSVSNSVVANGEAVVFTITFTDKEGDLQDSIWVQKISRTSGCGNFNDRAKIPSYTATSNLKGVFEVGYSNGIIPGSTYTPLTKCSKNDTCYFKFWARDNAKNVSDTITSSDIVVLK